MNVELLKNHHKNIRQIISEIEESLKAGDVAGRAFDFSLKIGKLSGLLVLHLKSEDEFLYPSLRKVQSIEVRNLAESFNKEMGSLAEDFMNYKRTYMLAYKIKEQPDAFVQETRKIFLALKNRLDKEDHKLYPLLS